jgi:hypothetical protein
MHARLAGDDSGGAAVFDAILDAYAAEDEGGAREDDAAGEEGE